MCVVACGPGPRQETAEVDAQIHSDAATCVSTGEGSLDLENDDHNCGTPCRDCTVCGGTCAGGRCTLDTLVADTSATTQLAVDATRVYWVDVGNDVPGSGRVLAVNKRGGTPEVLVDGETRTVGVAVDSSNLYWTNGSTAQSSGSVKKQPLAGGSAIMIDAAPTYNPAWIYGSAAGVYWFGTGTSGLYASTASDPLREVAPPLASGYASAGGLIYYLHAESAGGQELRSSPDGGGVSSMVASRSTSTWSSLAAGRDGIYLTAEVPGDVVRVPYGGGTPVVVASAQARPLWIVADDRAAYWSNIGAPAANGEIMKIAPDGPPEELATVASPMQLAIDDSCVYILSVETPTAPFRGSLLRVAR